MTSKNIVKENTININKKSLSSLSKNVDLIDFQFNFDDPIPNRSNNVSNSLKK